MNVNQRYATYPNELTGAFSGPAGVGTSYYVQTPIPIVLGTWNHVAWTYDQSAMKLYFNGQPISTNVIGPQTIATSSTPLRISGADTQTYFDGEVDEASVYNTALSAAQILAIYSAGSTGKCPSPPVIMSQPVGDALFVGNTATFSVNAWGLRPLSYQWLLGTNAISVATNATATSATLVLTNVQLGQSGGMYSVVVSNLLGSTNSSNVVLTVTLPPPCDPAPTGLVSWWAGEGNANDSVGTNDGMLQGGVSFSGGEAGQAFSFDGVSGTVVVPDSSSLRLTNQLTIEAWIKPLTTNGGQSIVAKVSSTTGLNGYQFDLYNNELTGAFSVSGGSWPSYYVQTPIPIVLGTWNHVAWTYDQSAMKLYFNGQPISTNVIGPQTIATSSTPLRISGADTQTYFDGEVDEASVYNTALSAAQILAIYSAGSAGKCPVPVAPVITNQPANEAVVLGNTASFSVAVTGTAPLSFKWLSTARPFPRPSTRARARPRWC